MLTTINAFDGGFDTQTTLTSKTLETGTTTRDLIKSLIGDFPNLNQGAVGEYSGEFKRPVVLNGNTLFLLKQYTNNQVFIDLGKVNALKDGEVILGEVPLINGDTGLLETPQRADAYLNIVTLFEPAIVMGQVLEMVSETLPIYNGQYKVIGATHTGIISEAVGGQCTTRLTLLLGARYFGKFKVINAAETNRAT